jgi:hypothetical protein
MNPLRSGRDLGCRRSVVCVVAVSVLVVGCGRQVGPGALAHSTTTTVGPTTTTSAHGTPRPSPSSTEAPGQAPPASGPLVESPGERISAVGDSVMLDAAPDLESDIPGIVVDAAVSRQWSDGEVVLEQLKATDQLGTIVVVGLGTNGPITASDFDAMMTILSAVPRVVFVTVHVDRPWQDEVNAVLEAGVTQHENAVIADWASLAAENPEWFYADGTHLPIGGVGAQALAALIEDACR